MRKSILVAVIFAGLLAEGVVPAAWADTSKTAKGSHNPSSAKRRAKSPTGRAARPRKHAPIVL